MSRISTLKKMAALTLVALAVCGIVALGLSSIVKNMIFMRQEEPVGNKSSATPRKREQPRLTVQLVELPLHRPEQADRAALPDVVRANNAFALDLYQKLRTEPGNFLISPACLTAGLGLLRAGARGETAAELDRVLHRPGTFTNRALAAMIQDLNADGKDRSFQVRLANAAWVQQGVPLLDDYRATLRDVFAIDDDRRVDFTGDPARAADTINAWVSDRTGGKITDVLRPEAVAPPTKLVLTSALYFRGNWDEGFLRPATIDAEFHVTQARSITVTMMRLVAHQGVHRYVDAGAFEALSLACGQGAYVMNVLLPKEIEGLADLEATLTPERLEALWPKLEPRYGIFISLPRFRLRSSRALEPALKGLGLTRAFVQKQADFSGINGKSDDLFVAAVNHETFLDVNEEGIEAAALTGVLGASSNGAVHPPVIRVDHPFVCLIRDARSGAIVFLGRVVNPLD